MNFLHKAAGIFIAVLREVFDESAYERFLRIQQVPSSASAYAAFCREREVEYARRSRCC